MNLKRLIVGGSAVALMLGSAVPAFAEGNVAIIKDNNTSATANTGSNNQDNYEGNTVSAGLGNGNAASVNSSGSRSITTGDAKAKAKSYIVANVNVGCGCQDSGNGGDPLAEVRHNNTSAGANSGANTQDNLGDNTVSAGMGHGNAASVDTSGSRSITTGGAKAKAKSWVVVNANVSLPW